MSANGRVQQRLLQFTVDRYRKPAEADAVHATSPASRIRRRHDLEPGYEERGRPFAHSIRAALEVFFFHNVAREMAQTMTDDMKEFGLTREDYFRSLLDARYRQLIAKQVLADAKKVAAMKKH